MGSSPSASSLAWREQWVVTGKLHHSTGSPTSRGDMELCSTLIRVHTVWIKQTKTTGTSFERNSCQQSMQKYKIYLTQRHISKYWDFWIWIAIPCKNGRGPQIRKLWTGSWIWSECTHWWHIYQTLQWSVVLPSTLSLLNIYWVSGIWLQGRLTQCKPRD